MQPIIDLVQAHWGTVSFSALWIFSVFASRLVAPTAQSSMAYKNFFSIMNGIAGNLSRASSTTIEASPNWQPAVEKHLEAAGK